jgi:GrpB-like predicted nucleotidyltransferase (UPF0157 family)
MARRITLEPHNAQWATDFAVEAHNLRQALNETLLHIHHIGSTSVPGLIAKPVIDILLEVISLDSLDEQNNQMTALGYSPRGEYGISGRRYFVKGGERRTHHVHAFEAGSMHIIRHLAFRDYLQRNGDIASQYADIKLSAAKHCQNSSEIYSQLKNDFIARHEALALAER